MARLCRITFAILALVLAAPGAWAQSTHSPWWGSTRANYWMSRALTDAGFVGVPRFATPSLPTCDTTNTGAVAFDTSATQLVVCNGTSWVAPAVTGSGVAKQVAIWDSTSTIRGDADFTFDYATDTLYGKYITGATGSFSSASYPTMMISYPTVAVDTVYPLILDRRNGDSPGVVGSKISMIFMDATGTGAHGVYGQFGSTVLDNSGNAAGELWWRAAESGGSIYDSMRLRHDSLELGPDHTDSSDVTSQTIGAGDSTAVTGAGDSHGGYLTLEAGTGTGAGVSKVYIKAPRQAAVATTAQTLSTIATFEDAGTGGATAPKVTVADGGSLVADTIASNAATALTLAPAATGVQVKSTSWTPQALFTIPANSTLTNADNLIAGVGAGAACTTCDDNVFVGDTVGDVGSDIDKAVCVGYGACSPAATGIGDETTAIGQAACDAATGIGSTCIGSSANVSAGANNATALGRSAAVTGSGGIALGAYSSAPANTLAVGFDSTQIGNAYFGVGVNDASGEEDFTVFNLRSSGSTGGENLQGSDFAVYSGLGTGNDNSGFLVYTPTVEASGSTAQTANLTAKFYSSGTGTATGALLDLGEAADTTGSTITGLSTTGPLHITAASNTVRVDGALGPGITADAALQVGMIAMVDAGTDGRFDVNGAGGTLAIGVYQGTGASVAASAYEIAQSGVAWMVCDEDVAITRGHVLYQDAGTAGYCDDNAALQATGTNIGRALYSEAVTATINPAGCTGGAGCVNTALNTPNAGPAGQITLGVDVAALGWVAGEPVVYWDSGGTAIAGLTSGAVYWLLSVATTNVTLAATKGGTIIVPTTQGDDATQYLQRLPRAVIHVQ